MLETVPRQQRPLRVMIAGAPAAGKGTQCVKIVEKVRRPANVLPSFERMCLSETLRYFVGRTLQIVVAIKAIWITDRHD